MKRSEAFWALRNLTLSQSEFTAFSTGMATYLCLFETGASVLGKLYIWNPPIKQNAIGFFFCFLLSRKNIPFCGDALAGKGLHIQGRNAGITQEQMLIYYSWKNPQ